MNALWRHRLVQRPLILRQTNEWMSGLTHCTSLHFQWSGASSGIYTRSVYNDRKSASRLKWVKNEVTVKDYEEMFSTRLSNNFNSKSSFLLLKEENTFLLKTVFFKYCVQKNRELSVSLHPLSRLWFINILKHDKHIFLYYFSIIPLTSRFLPCCVFCVKASASVPVPVVQVVPVPSLDVSLPTLVRNGHYQEGGVEEDCTMKLTLFQTGNKHLKLTSSSLHEGRVLI